MHVLFLSCLKATELIEKRFHFKLSLTERIQLKMHKMMCDACTKYEKQSTLIEKSIASNYKRNATLDIENLKSKISKILEDNGKS